MREPILKSVKQVHFRQFAEESAPKNVNVRVNVSEVLKAKALLSADLNALPPIITARIVKKQCLRFLQTARRSPLSVPVLRVLPVPEI